MPQRPPYLSIALISAASLAYEILLMRLFSIIQWHHFGYMIISLALLGYGISGTVVSIAREKLLSRYQQVYISCLLIFSLSAIICFLTAQAIPFNAEEIFWDSRQALYLLCLFLLLTIPFFFAATAICLTFIRFNGQVSRTYAMDLIGAGMGSLGIVILLFLVFPQTALILLGSTGLIAVIFASWELRVPQRLWVSFATILIIAVVLITGHSFNLNISPYKSLQQTLLVNGTQIIDQRSSPLGLLSVVESKNIPLRHAPGLSLLATQEPLPQLGVFTDGGNMTVITQRADNPEQLSYLDYMTSALPYHLEKMQQVLILGAGGGADILQADFHHAAKIDAVELNSQLIDLVKYQYNEFAGKLYQQKNITLHNREARGFLIGSKQHYDLIALALIDDFNASSSGLYALNESYLYTTEALQLYLNHLEPDGYLAITRWIKMPPRDTLKLFVTAIDALKQSGYASPDQQLALIRSWQTSTLLIKNGEFSNQELNAIQTFCANRSFDLAYTPDISETQINRYNILTSPIFYQGTLALLSEKRPDFLDQYKFNLNPATDDKPYFHHFFKWSTLPEIIHLRDKGGMPLLEWGYLIFIATLLIAIIMSVILILLPLRFYSYREVGKERELGAVNFRIAVDESTKKIKRFYVIYYFFTIGLAFLFVEIAFIQKFTLFLHHPIYAISVTLAAFLVFAGLGSNCSARFSKRRARRRAISFAVCGIVLFCVLFLFTSATLFAILATTPLAIKVLFSILLIAPLAFLMGMPFPLALSSLANHAEQFIPWAWGINGCASVISTVLATLLAIHFGFAAVILLALLLYSSIVFMFPEPQ